MKTRRALKRAIKNVFLLLVLPAFLVYEFLCLIGNRDSTFQSFSQAFSLIPGKLGVYIRAAFYRLACPDTSDEISIGFLTLLSHHDTTIESGVYIGPQSNIGKCRINKNTLIGSGVHILSGRNQHRFSDLSAPIHTQGGSYKKIQIGEDCWIGNGSLIMSDVSNKSVVAAGTVIIKPDFPEATIVAGNPAKIIGHRT